MAALALGWDEIATVRTDLKDELATGWAIVDNRGPELGDWDGIVLAETLRSLQSEDFDLSAVGFTDDEINAQITAIADTILPPDADGREFDESIANEVEYHTCPGCSHRWPK